MEPYLSVVVTVRGGDARERDHRHLQRFAECLDAHCARAGLDAELIVVEWDVRGNHPVASSLLRLPENPSCAYRFVELLSEELPAVERNAEAQDLAARNVGIRRAHGEFVLATNVDVVLSQELIDYMASDQLRPGYLYRVDRRDVVPDPPDGTSVDDQLDHCRAHQRRVHTRWGPYDLDTSDPDHVPFLYPPTGWESGNPGSGVRPDFTSDGIFATSARERASYVLWYGPLVAAESAATRFDVVADMVDGRITAGLLNGDRTTWIPARVRPRVRGTTQTLEVVARLERHEAFWIVVSNDYPGDEGVSRFRLRALKGSIDPARTIVPPERPPAWRRLADKLGLNTAALKPRRSNGQPDFDRRSSLHLDGCADFQLMARRDWEEMRGYAEFNVGSTEIFALLSHTARAAGIGERTLEWPVYRVGLDRSSSGPSREDPGRTPRPVDADAVRKWAADMSSFGRPLVFNSSGWGGQRATTIEHVIELNEPWRATTRRFVPEHPVFDLFSPFTGSVEPGFERGFYGVNVRDWLFAGVSKGFNNRRFVHAGCPPVDDEYFEWIALLTAIASARKGFCFAEIGAGWGRWSVSAAALCRQKQLDFRLIAVEPEPSHFESLKVVFEDNNIHPADHVLFQGAVGVDDGTLLLFGRDNPRAEYGQCVIDAKDVAVFQNMEGYTIREVSSVTFQKLFAGVDVIDLIDMDVQGSERDIIASSMDVLNEKVRMVHIGTHSASIEAELLSTFSRHRWLNAFCFPAQAESLTPYGRVVFGDGVQTWVNPRWPSLHTALAGASPAEVLGRDRRHDG